MSGGVPPVKGPEGKPPQDVKSKTDEQARAEKFREMMRVEAVDPEQKRRGTKQGEEAAKKEENEAAAGEEGEVHTAHTAKRQEEKSDVAPFPALFAEAPPSPGPMMGSATPSGEKGGAMMGSSAPSGEGEGIRTQGTTPPPAAPHTPESHYTLAPPSTSLPTPSTQSTETQQESSSDQEASDAALEAARQAAALAESIKSGKRPPSQVGETAKEKATKERETAASEKKKEIAASTLPKKPELPAKAGAPAKPAPPPEEPSKPVAPPLSRPPPSKEELSAPFVPPKKSTSEPLLGTAATTPHAEEPEEVSPHESVQPSQPVQEKESLPSRVEKKEKGKEKEVTLPAGPSTAAPLISGIHDAAAPLVHAPIEPSSGPPSPFSTAYSNLHPEVLEVLDRLVGQIQVSLANGLQETRVTYSSRIPSSVFNGSQIIVRRYASAADEFNVTIVADPRAAERLRAQLPDLRTALVDPRFKVQRLEVVLATEAAEKGEFQRKEGLSDEEGQSDTEGESR